MSERLFAGAVVALIGAAGVWCLRLGWSELQETRRFVRRSKITSGTVVRMQVMNDPDTNAEAPVVTFTTESRESRTFTSRHGSQPPRYKVGDAVPVRYDPGDAARAEVDGGAIYGFSAIALVLGGLATVAGLAGLYVLIFRASELH